jgi:hypothetical protein
LNSMIFLLISGLWHGNGCGSTATSHGQCMPIAYMVLHNTLPFSFSKSFVWLYLVAVGCDLSHLLSQLVVMAPPVSLELHECIIAWCYELHLPINNIVCLSNCCDKTVCNVLKIYQDYDAFTHPFTQPRGCKCLLD